MNGMLSLEQHQEHRFDFSHIQMLFDKCLVRIAEIMLKMLYHFLFELSLLNLTISHLIIFLSSIRRTINSFGFNLFYFFKDPLVVSGLNLIIMGYVADEMGLGGDSTSTILFLVLLVVCIFNGFVYTNPSKETGKCLAFEIHS